MENTEFFSEPMSAQDFALLGIQQIAYIKSLTREGVDGFAVYAADGSEIAYIQKSREVAFATVRQHDLEPVDVH